MSALGAEGDCSEADDPRCAGPSTDPAPDVKYQAKPAPWAVDIAKAPATWCEGADLTRNGPVSVYGGKGSTTELISKIEGTERGNAGFEQFVRRAAASSCFAPAKEARQAWVAIARQRLSNHEGTSSATIDAQYAAALMSQQTAASEMKKACSRWSEAKRGTASEKAVRASMLTILECKLDAEEALVAHVDLAFAARSPRFSSELEKAHFLFVCLGSPSPDAAADGDAVRNQTLMSGYLACGKDLREMDRAAFEAAVAAAKLGVVEQSRIGREWGVAYRVGTQLTTALQVLAAKDPDFKKVMFEAPEKGFKQWEKAFEAEKPAILVAQQLELDFADTLPRKSQAKAAFSKCAPTARKAFVAHLKQHNPKTTAELINTATDAAGAPLLSALIACEMGAGHFALAQGLRKLLLTPSQPLDTPRDAAFLAGSLEMASVRAERPKFGVPPARPSSARSEWIEGLAGQLLPDDKASTYGDGEWFAIDGKVDPRESFDGVVQSVSPKGEAAVVTFKTESWKEQVFDCKPTNRVERIDFSGDRAEVIYAQNCTPAGFETRSAKLPSMLVFKEYLGGIKPGVRLRVYQARTKAKGASVVEGFGLEGFSDPARKKLVHLLGIPL